MRKESIAIVFFTGIILFFSNCATIVSKSSYPISINSTPSEAKIVVTDKKGLEIYSGTTPAVMKLSAGYGFFGKAQYQVKFSKEGYDTKTVPVFFTLDGWYFGNILFGGLIGMLIVDPATGAMYKLDTEYLNESLTRSYVSTATEELKIYTLDEIPEAWKSHLVEMID
jgi:hypothetical protein